MDIRGSAYVAPGAIVAATAQVFEGAWIGPGVEIGPGATDRPRRGARIRAPEASGENAQDRRRTPSSTAASTSGRASEDRPPR